MLSFKRKLAVWVRAIAKAFIFICVIYKCTVHDEDMLLPDRGENDALPNISPRSIFGFTVNFSVDVFAPSAQIERLLDWLSNRRLGWWFMNVCIASVVIGYSPINRGRYFLDPGSFLQLWKVEHFHLSIYFLTILILISSNCHLIYLFTKFISPLKYSITISTKTL